MPCQLVEYVLGAEFDIDKGSTLRDAYPRRVPGFEDGYFAEKMLPEGAHNHAEDWTVYFLNTKSAPVSGIATVTATTNPVECLVDRVGGDCHDGASNTNPGNGSIFTTMGVCVRAVAPSIKIVVSPKIVGRDSINLGTPLYSGVENAAVQGEECLVEFDENEPEKIDYQVENDLCVSFLTGNEDNSRVRLIFETANCREQFDDMLARATHNVVPCRFFYCVNLVCNRSDKNVRRGAIVKALTVVTRFPFIQVFRTIIRHGLDMYYKSTTQSTLEQVFATINALDLSSASPTTPLERKMLRRAVARPQYGASHGGAIDPLRLQLKWNKDGIDLTVPVNIPMCTEADDVGEASVQTLLSKFGKQTMMIMNAVLQERRVLFLAKMAPAKEVCDLVLATCCLVSPPLFGLVQRSYPYANLNDLDFLEVKGYIAGVTNPVFEGNSNWWDLLCNLDTGKVVTSAEHARAKAAQSSSPSRATMHAQDIPEGRTHDDIDKVFIERVLSGVRRRFGERWVRAQFRDYTQRLLDMAFGESATIVSRPGGDDGRDRVLTASEIYVNASQSQNQRRRGSTVSALVTRHRHSIVSCGAEGPRVRAFQNTETFKRLDRYRDLRSGKWERESSSRKDRHIMRSLSVVSEARRVKSVWDAHSSNGMNLRRRLRRLQCAPADLENVERLQIYQALVESLRSESDLKELLVLLPESQGGLMPLAMGLMHESDKIRRCTVKILQKLESLPSTRDAVHSLNFFLVSAFQRQGEAIRSDRSLLG